MSWLSRLSGRGRGGDTPTAQRPAMVPIEIDSWSGPGNAHRTLCITQADWSIRWHLRTHYGVREPEYERRGSEHAERESFDVYEAVIPGSRREYWMNVSYWYGRGLLMEPGRLNAPPPGDAGSMLDFLGGYELGNLPFREDVTERLKKPLGLIELRFAGYSSRQFYNNVAFLDRTEERPVVQATAVRRFLADSLPLFHGFRFVKPFLMHQAMHLISGENPRQTEAEPQADYVLPEPGRDCVAFRPAATETPANDFWNYTLWAHRPGAFEGEGERRLLETSAMTAISSGFVTAEELLEGLAGMDVRGADGEALRDLAAGWASRETGGSAGRDS